MTQDGADLGRRRLLGMAAVGATGLAATAPAQAQVQAASAIPRYQPAVRVRMRDGIHVVLSLQLPEGNGPFPVILMKSLDRRRVIDRPGPQALLAAGYAFASADARGRFDSEGVFDPTYGAQDGRDMQDTVEWLAGQSWCDGNVGTYGASHQAYYQISMSKEGKPAHLRAMATWTGGYRGGRTEGAGPPLSGGVTPLGTTLIWLPNEAGETLERLEKEGQDMKEAHAVLQRMRTHPRETFEHLPLLEAPITRYGKLKELLEYRLQRNALPDDGVPSPDPKDVHTPTFHEAGWYDHAAWAQIEGFNNLRKGASTPQARAGQHIVLGPWPHGMVFQDRLGDIYFGPTANNAGSGLDRLQVRFFDKYVRGRAVDVPHVTYFVMGANEWKTSDTWPPAGVKRTRFYLHSKGKANAVTGDGSLSLVAPKSERPDRYLYDPERPVPTLGGALDWQLNLPGMIAGPIEQSPVERRSDVLCYTTAPFDRDVEISGPMVLNLFASTSAKDADFVAKVTEVHADGRSYNIQEGVLRLSGRDLKGAKQPVTAGEVYELRIGVGHTSILIRKGHALRLQVTSSNFPMWDRNMGTDNPAGVDAKGVKADQTVFHTDGRASYLELPVLDT